MMTRLINADKLLRPFDAWKDRLTGRDSDISKCVLSALRSVIRTIDAAPTVDAVPIVRCKDCALRGDDKCPMMWWEEIVTDEDGWEEYDYAPHDRTTDDGFCHMGRRADNV